MSHRFIQLVLEVKEWPPALLPTVSIASGQRPIKSTYNTEAFAVT